MKESLKTGLSFGTTSGIITTIGLIVGLNAGTHSVLAVIGGIITIAVADGLSESMGMYISKKSESKHSSYIWESTVATLIAKVLVTLTFAIPVILIDLPTAVMINIFWGLFLLTVLSYFLSDKKEKKWEGILGHLLIAIFVIITAYYVGEWIYANFS